MEFFSQFEGNFMSAHLQVLALFTEYYIPSSSISSWTTRSLQVLFSENSLLLLLRQCCLSRQHQKQQHITTHTFPDRSWAVAENCRPNDGRIRQNGARDHSGLPGRSLALVSSMNVTSGPSRQQNLGAAGQLRWGQIPARRRPVAPTDCWQAFSQAG